MVETKKPWTVQPRAIRQPPYTAEVPGYTAVEGETIPRRNIRTREQLRSRPHDDVNTVYELVRYSAAKFGNAKAMGSRKVLRTHVETKKVKRVVDGREEETEKQWSFFELSGYHYISFVDYEQRVLQLGAGLRKLGLEPGDRLQIYASTRFVM